MKARPKKKKTRPALVLFVFASLPPVLVPCTISSLSQRLALTPISPPPPHTRSHIAGSAPPARSFADHPPLSPPFSPFPATHINSHDRCRPQPQLRQAPGRLPIPGNRPPPPGTRRVPPGRAHHFLGHRRHDGTHPTHHRQGHVRLRSGAGHTGRLLGLRRRTGPPRTAESDLRPFLRAAGRVAVEIVVSDGSKCDIGRLQRIFGRDATVTLQDLGGRRQAGTRLPSQARATTPLSVLQPAGRPRRKSDVFILFFARYVSIDRF